MQDGGQNMPLEKCEQIQPFVGCVLQAAVIEVVAVDVDTRAQFLAIQVEQFLYSKNEKTGMSRLFPPTSRWSGHTGALG